MYVPTRLHMHCSVLKQDANHAAQVVVVLLRRARSKILRPKVEKVQDFTQPNFTIRVVLSFKYSTYCIRNCNGAYVNVTSSHDVIVTTTSFQNLTSCNAGHSTPMNGRRTIRTNFNTTRTTRCIIASNKLKINHS
jgi:hypothetical protein